MSNIQLTTLTPVHVGSGDLLQYNADFVEDKIGSNSYIYVVEPAKILQLIGMENIDRWISIIENAGNTKEFVQKFSPIKSPEAFSSRKILNFAKKIQKGQILNETIHNGFGFPYIPGSSLKGAIRTAVLASLVGRVNDKEEKILSKDRKGKTIISDKKIQNELFGNDAKNDLFRFVEVGDAYFEKGSEAAFRMIHLNITNKNSLLDDSKSQIVETIDQEKTSFFRLNINLKKYRFAKENWEQAVSFSRNRVINSPNVLPECLQSIENLFQTINAHTLKLVEDEIKIWEDVDKEGTENYLDVMESIKSEIINCTKGKECILRLGHASGWRFITGAWPEKLDNFVTKVVPAARPNNGKYQDYIFPKTRRVGEDYQDLLGFVRLTLID
ncbi:MAG TPA: type III-A CRISPR-associated RAMP protein Csm5 [Paludibacteraceae bacterium]|mgnify:CR=1 FL=1|nr:type III-A CRISPR-associated RAMP protein Csm5 [Paludibacteraceae bacterium]